MRNRKDGVIGDSAALAAALDHLSQLAAIDRRIAALEDVRLEQRARREKGSGILVPAATFYQNWQDPTDPRG